MVGSDDSTLTDEPALPEESTSEGPFGDQYLRVRTQVLAELLDDAEVKRARANIDLMAMRHRCEDLLALNMQLSAKLEKAEKTILEIQGIAAHE